MQRTNKDKLDQLFKQISILTLPDEVLVEIFKCCSVKLIILTLSRVSQNFLSVSRSGFLWDFKFAFHFPSKYKRKKVANESIAFSDFKVVYTESDDWVDSYYLEESSSSQLDKDADNKRLERAKQFYSVIEDSVVHLQNLNLNDFFLIKNKNNFNLLSQAIHFKSQSVLDYIWLLAIQNLQVDENTSMFDETYAFGNGILHWAALTNRSADEISALIAVGANINLARRDDGVTPLYFATKNGFLALVKCFFKHGANVNLAISNGETPLLAAVYSGNLEMVKALISIKLILILA